MTLTKVRISAQAKINLHLRVLAREDSGYHSLETLFHRIDLADEITVEATHGERTLDVSGNETGSTESNLAWRAALSYTEAAGWPAGFRIALDKRIPVGAGLGGGSADAAAVLCALDYMSPRPIGAGALAQLAGELGADVAFLVSDAVMALAWGRGERLLALPPLPARDVVLLTPSFGVSTADAYRWLDDDRATSELEGDTVVRETTPSIVPVEALGSWDSISEFAVNDFEGPVLQRHPELMAALNAIRSIPATLTRMSGSGSTVFGVVNSLPSAAWEVEGATFVATRTSTSVSLPVAAVSGS